MILFKLKDLMIIEIDARLNLANFNYTIHTAENQKSKNHTSEIVHQKIIHQTSKNHTSEIRHLTSEIKKSDIHISKIHSIKTAL